MLRRIWIILSLLALIPCGVLAQETTTAPQPPNEQIHLSELYTPPDTYKVDYYLRAAIALQALGKTQAIQALTTLANGKTQGASVFVLCRMVFTQKGHVPFRRPLIGMPIFLGGRSNSEWPLEPIAFVDGIPFKIVRGYSLAGLPEPPAWYLKYCLQNCDWNPTKFELKGKLAKKQALEKLLAAHHWNTEPEAREFLSPQID